MYRSSASGFMSYPLGLLQRYSAITHDMQSLILRPCPGAENVSSDLAVPGLQADTSDKRRSS